jgi:uncharacterized protein (TIGR00730 family)
MHICVFCSSSDAVDGEYFTVASELGALIVKGGHTLVFGGGRVGLMGALARAAHENGGRVVGIIPRFMDRPRVTYAESDEIIVTEDLRERKARMMGIADAFIALPGGFGTLEEIAETITQKHFGFVKGPLVLINHARFYDPLADMFEKYYAERFAKQDFRSACVFVKSPAHAMDSLRDFTPSAPVSKWF